MAEYWDLYNRDRVPINKIHRRGASLQTGEYHVVVEIVTMNPNGMILLTKRHPNKPFGNTWECTGGSVVSGETSRDGAKRELLEETGIDIPPEELIFLTSLTTIHQIYDEYLAFTDMTVSELRLQETEVCDARFVPLSEIHEMHKRGEFNSPVYDRILRHPELYMKYLRTKKRGNENGT